MRSKAGLHLVENRASKPVNSPRTRLVSLFNSTDRLVFGWPSKTAPPFQKQGGNRRIAQSNKLRRSRLCDLWTTDGEADKLGTSWTPLRSSFEWYRPRKCRCTNASTCNCSHNSYPCGCEMMTPWSSSVDLHRDMVVGKSGSFRHRPDIRLPSCFVWKTSIERFSPVFGFVFAIVINHT